MAIFGNKGRLGINSYMMPGGMPGAEEPPLEPGQIRRADWDKQYDGEGPAMNVRDIGDHLGVREKGGFFGKGGAGSDILGWARDILAYGPTAPIARMQREQNESRYQDQQAEDAQRIALARRAQDRADNKIDWVGQGDDLIGFDGSGRMVDRMTGQPSQTQRQKDFDAYKGMSPEDRALFDRSGLGGGNSAYAYDRRAQVKQLAPGKAPGGGGGRGGGVTATSRAKAIGDAESAIARGADRNAVYARLAKMGIK